jgi:serine/threonine protein kinase
LSNLSDPLVSNETGEDVTQTAEGTVVGTAAYMSPEQAQGKALDERSDIFSVGAILYELLSGRRAFEGHSFLETLNAVVYREPRPLQSPAANIVKRCLAKDPAQRFQSAVELKAALDQCPTGIRNSIPRSRCCLSPT